MLSERLLVIGTFRDDWFDVKLEFGRDEDLIVRQMAYQSPLAIVALEVNDLHLADAVLTSRSRGRVLCIAYTNHRLRYLVRF